MHGAERSTKGFEFNIYVCHYAENILIPFREGKPVESIRHRPTICRLLEGNQFLTNSQTTHFLWIFIE